MKNVEPYNPLDKRHLGESVADALLAQPLMPLKGIVKFTGAGIYAIYYSGDFEIYNYLMTMGNEVPIYVGKAVPPGARKGEFGLEGDPGDALFKRLKEHKDSIVLASNLNIKDFTCRYLVADDIWIPLGESLMIARFSPVWNKLVDGFGNHDPGSGRYKQQRSRWDTLHPGRKWVVKCKKRTEHAEAIITEVKNYLQDL